MAKYETVLRTDLNKLVSYLDQSILAGSTSASFEDSSYRLVNGVDCLVRVYERYSMIGSNRLSLTLTFIRYGNEVFISAITSGGSKGVLFKFNTIGEESFLDQVVGFIENYHRY